MRISFSASGHVDDVISQVTTQAKAARLDHPDAWPLIVAVRDRICADARAKADNGNVAVMASISIDVEPLTPPTPPAVDTAETPEIEREVVVSDRPARPQQFRKK